MWLSKLLVQTSQPQLSALRQCSTKVRSRPSSTFRCSKKASPCTIIASLQRRTPQLLSCPATARPCITGKYLTSEQSARVCKESHKTYSTSPALSSSCTTKWWTERVLRRSMTSLTLSSCSTRMKRSSSTAPTPSQTRMETASSARLKKMM